MHNFFHTPFGTRVDDKRSPAARRRLRRLRRLFFEKVEDRCLLATVYWDLAGPGNWNVATNWTGDQLPAAGDDVVINNLTAGQVVTVNTLTPQLNSVTASSRLTLAAGGTLNVNGSVQAAGDVLVSGGTLQNAAVVPGTTVALTATGGTLNGVTINGPLNVTTYYSLATVTNGLTLNGTATLGDNARLQFNGTQTLGGTGIVNFNDVTNSGYANALQTSGSNMTLTIGAGVTVRGGATGSYGSSIGYGNGWSGNGSNVSIVNLGTISSDRAGGNIWVTPNNGTLNNQGQLAVNGGNLLLGGSMTTATLGIAAGRVTHAGGSGAYYLTGIVDNSGATFPLNTTVGSWFLYGGAIENGTVTASNGKKLILTTSNTSRLTNVTLNGDLDATTLNSIAIITGGLTLNGTATLGNEARLQFNGTQTLGGTGTVVFNDVTNSGYGNALQATGSNMTLTIGAGITIRGGATGSYGSSIGIGNGWSGNGSNITIVNLGTISSDRVGGNIWVTPHNGLLQNQGQLAVNGGNLLLGGNMTIASLGIPTPGRVTHAGGSGAFYLTGVLDNSGTTLPLSAAIGSWYLFGGAIENGTVTAADGKKLFLTTSANSRLTNVTMNADLDATILNSVATITNGMTLNGTATLGNEARLLFNGDQTLGGTGTVVFNDVTNSGYGNAIIASGSNMTLTIGAQMTIRGGATGSYGSSIGFGNGFSGSGSNTSIVNLGTITADRVGANIWVAPNNGTLTNQGQLAVNGGNLLLGGNMTIASLGVLTPGRVTHAGGSGAFYLSGVLDNSGTTLQLSAAIGSWFLFGGAIENGTVTATDGKKLFLTTNTNSRLTNVTLNADLDATTLNSVATVTNGLVLNSTATLGNNARLMFNGTQTLGGTGTVVFNDVTNSGYGNALMISGSNMTLTIGAGMTIRGGATGSYGSSIGYSYGFSGNGSNTNIVNLGTISAERVGAGIWITPNGGTLTNQGLLAINGGVIGLGGNTTIASLGILTPGRLTHAGGSGNFHLTGILTNTNTTLPLSAAVGSWHINGGAIENGTVTATDGTRLILSSNTGNRLTNVTLNADLDSTILNSQATITNGLILNSTATLGNNARLLFNGTQTLGGTGTVVFNDVTNSGYANALMASGSNMTLTIGAGMTIRGGATGSYGSSIGYGYGFSGSGINTNIVNLGTISAERANAGIWITPNGGTLTNQGLLAINGGNIGLGGNTTIASLGILTPGRLTHAGGSGNFNLTGILTNTGTTLPLSPAVGSWFLNGGTIQGGTVSTSGGVSLMLTNSTANALNGVTINGDLRATNINSQVIITGGLTLNGTATLGDNARLNFNGTQTLGGNGLVILNPTSTSFYSNDLIASGSNMTLTIGAGITIRGGAVGSYGSSLGDSDLFTSGSNTSVVNLGTIIADGAGQIINIRPHGSGTFTNSGTISSQNGGVLHLVPSFTASGPGILTESTTGSLQVSGNLLSTTTELSRFNLPGGVIMRGNNTTTSPWQLLEAPAQDLGNVAAGFVNNFAFGTLSLTNRARVQLVNPNDNSPGAGNEAVYVDSLIVPANTVLDLNGLNLYTRSSQIATPGTSIITNGGSITVLPGGGVIPLGVPASGSILVAGQVHNWNFFAGPGMTITVVVNPGSSGLNPPATPFLNGVRILLVDPNNNVIGDVTNNLVGGVLVLNQTNFTITGTYTIRVQAPAGSPNLTGNYSITIWDSTFSTQAIVVNQTYQGDIPSPYSIDHWTFSAVAGQQIQLDLIAASTAGLLFTLYGPSGQVITGLDNISGDSSVLTLLATGNYTLVVTSNPTGTAIGGYSFQIIRLPYVPLQVTAMTPTSTGFVVDFNRNLNPAELSLYDIQGGSIGVADIVLQGATTGAQRGSVAVEPNLRRLTFITTTGRLLPDDYTLTLRSASNAFFDEFSYLLDGDADNTPGGNYVANFTVTAAPANAVSISLPNFARGPQQPVNLPASSATGIPLSFSDGAGITSAFFQLRYNPALLVITGASVAAGLPAGAGVSIFIGTPGFANIQFTSPTALAAGTTRFVNLQATVPATAPYRSKNILDLTNIVLNGGSIPGLDDDAVQVAAYFGDTTGNGLYSATDASRISRLAVGFDTGFQLYKLLDPYIIGDISGNGGISSTDASRMLQASVGFPVADIPALPLPAVSLVAGGPDPKLSISTDLVARAGGELIIPVDIDSIVDLTGTGLESADLVIYYDAGVLDVTSASLGSLVANHDNWMIALRIDALSGRIFVSLAGNEPLEGFFQGELVQLHATVKADAATGPTAINLAASARDTAHYTQLNEGYLTLIPAPTDAANDPGVDGVLMVLPAANQIVSNVPRAEWLEDRLTVVGTDGDDRIFIGNIGEDQIGVRVNRTILGRFPSSARIDINGLTGSDFIVDGSAAGVNVVSARHTLLTPNLADLLAGKTSSFLADQLGRPSDSSPRLDAIQERNDANHDVALLQLLLEVNDETSQLALNSGRRLRATK